MDRIPCFDPPQLEAACKVLGNTTDGLTGNEIGHILVDMAVDDPEPGTTKWKRLFNALALAQNTHQVGNHLIMFIHRAMNPVRYAAMPDRFASRRDALNIVLSFSGFRVREDGEVVRTTPASTLSEALARAGRLKAQLEARGTHAEVFKYCRAELLEDNYFHAVLEAAKGLAQRLRNLAGLGTDGAELINQAFSVKTPIIAFNSLQTETERSEQKGIANLMIGLVGAIRNPTAHAPKIAWPMSEQDALDVLALVSYLHRKLDNAVKL